MTEEELKKMCCDIAPVIIDKTIKDALLFGNACNKLVGKTDFSKEDEDVFMLAYDMGVTAGITAILKVLSEEELNISRN